MKRKHKTNILFLFITVAVAIISLTAMVQVKREISAKNMELTALDLEYEKQRIENREIERLFTLGDDIKYMERIAREKLGFVYPDERVFIDVSGS